AIRVDPSQLTSLIAVCVAGGWFGAGVVSSLSRRAVQLGMGCALLSAAAFMMYGMLGSFPAGGSGLVLSPSAFAIALAANLVLGALITLGVGNYAPSLILFSLLGMDPRAAFPIMMGSGAFVATVAGIRFVRAGRIATRAALGLTIGGVPGVIVAAWLVQSLPLAALRWLVLAVVLYPAATLIRPPQYSSPSIVFTHRANDARRGTADFGRRDARAAAAAQLHPAARPRRRRRRRHPSGGVLPAGRSEPPADADRSRDGLAVPRRAESHHGFLPQ